MIRYKRHPTWDSCLSIYIKHIRSESDKQANIPSAAKTEIETYIKSCSDRQKGFEVCMAMTTVDCMEDAAR